MASVKTNDGTEEKINLVTLKRPRKIFQREGHAEFIMMGVGDR